MTTTDIIKKAIKLPKVERLELARLLLFHDSADAGSKNVVSEWEQEISERIKAIDSGTAIGSDFENVIKNIETKLSICKSRYCKKQNLN